MKTTIKIRCAVVMLCNLAILPSLASAHYLWIATNEKAGEQAAANIYFEEAPRPGDGKYLDPFVARGTTWIRTVESPQPQKLKTEEVKDSGRRWLTASLPAVAPRSIDSYGKWGVYRYGDTDVLLHYYARLLDVRDHDALHEIGRAEQMALDMVPHEGGEQVEVKVLWQGKPAANRPIYVRGPQQFRETLKTGKDGVAAFTPKAEGQYQLRTFVEENESGAFEGKQYAKIRHNATMILPLPWGG